MRANASQVCGFLYWWFARFKDDEQRWEMDRVLGLLPENEVQQHNLQTIVAAGGEIG